MFGRFRNFAADARWDREEWRCNVYIIYNHARGTYNGAPSASLCRRRGLGTRWGPLDKSNDTPTVKLSASRPDPAGKVIRAKTDQKRLTHKHPNKYDIKATVCYCQDVQDRLLSAESNAKTGPHQTLKRAAESDGGKKWRHNRENHVRSQKIRPPRRWGASAGKVGPRRSEASSGAGPPRKAAGARDPWTAAHAAP
jgi:hypothetical protein